MIISNMDNEEFLDDEISVSDIAQKLWKKRGWIFIGLFIGFLSGMAFILMSAATKSDSLSYFIEFEGIKEESYPNGARFSPQYIKSPESLRELTNKYRIDEKYNLSDSLQISYGSKLLSSSLQVALL